MKSVVVLNLKTTVSRPGRFTGLFSLAQYLLEQGLSPNFILEGQGVPTLQSRRLFRARFKK